MAVYKTITPTPTAPLLMLHIPSLPYLKVVQLRSFSPIFLSSAPCLIPDEFHIATAMKAANHNTAYVSLAPPAGSGCLLVYNRSIPRKAYAFANFLVRLHMGTITR